MYAAGGCITFLPLDKVLTRPSKGDAFSCSFLDQSNKRSTLYWSAASSAIMVKEFAVARSQVSPSIRLGQRIGKKEIFSTAYWQFSLQ